MAAVMDEYLESPMDSDDVFPCKGCGEVRTSSHISVSLHYDFRMLTPLGYLDS